MSDEIEKIVSTQRRKTALAVVRRAALLSKARKEAKRLVEQLVEEDPSTRVVLLFGSVATGAVRSDHFDIDLAIDADDYLHLRTVAEKCPFEVDLVDLRSVSASFRKYISRKGIVLYGSIV